MFNRADIAMAILWLIIASMLLIWVTALIVQCVKWVLAYDNKRKPFTRKRSRPRPVPTYDDGDVDDD